MNEPQFETTVDTWLESIAPPPRETLLASVLEKTSRTRPMATWRAIWTVPAMRTQSAVLVGSPAVRLARATLALAIFVALAATVALVGAWLLRELAPRGTIVFTSTQAIGFEPEPTPHWWECGDDPDCIRIVTGSGEQTAWVYVLDPKGSEGPQQVAELQISRRTRAPAPLLSADGSFALIATNADNCNYGVVELETGTFTRHVDASRLLWSPSGSDLVYTTTESSEGGCGYGWWGDTEPPPPRVLHLLDARAGTDRALITLDQVVDAGRVEASPVGWWGDGRTLLLQVWATRESYYRRGGLGYAEWTWYEELDIDTGISRRLSTSDIGLSEDESLEGMSPDGSKVLIRHSSGMSVADLKTGARHHLGSACVESPSWSADGRWIVYLDCRDWLEGSGDDGNVDGLNDVPVYDYLVVVASAESAEQKIVGVARAASYPEMATPPRFAPDGSVVFWSDLDGTWTVAPDGSGLTLFDIPPDTSITWE